MSQANRSIGAPRLQPTRAATRLDVTAARYRRYDDCAGFAASADDLVTRARPSTGWSPICSPCSDCAPG